MTSDPPPLSVVVPVCNERDNVAALVHGITAALRGLTAFEIVFVDDGSTDGTADVLRMLRHEVPELRALRHAATSGQSAAIRTGVKAARGAWIVTLDGDGQNDPADIPHLLARRDASPGDVRLITGWRVHRHDPPVRRWASRIANAVRARVLDDATPDTGCGTRLFEREAFLELPWFDHMHRYLPALMQRAGWATLSVPVNHRPRVSGASKYGIARRAWEGLADLHGVAWLMRRAAAPVVEEL